MIRKRSKQINADPEFVENIRMYKQRLGEMGIRMTDPKATRLISQRIDWDKIFGTYPIVRKKSHKFKPILR